MNPPLRARPALSDDIAGVLHLLAQNQTAQQEVSRELPVTTQRQLAMWERVQKSPDVTVYVAEIVSGEAVGTACLSILPNLTYGCRPTAFIEAVVVAYANRRQGVATSLMQRAIDDAKAAGCHKVQLVSHKRHADDGAHDFYVGLGFAPEAEGFRLYLT